MFSADTKILVVDDMKTVRQLVKSGLRRIGLKNIIDTDDGDLAWDILLAAKEKEPFQLIISDWNMPRMKGIELLKKVRVDEVYCETPFVMLTAEAEQKCVIEAVKEKVSNYIVKPFAPEVLEIKLKQVYNRIAK